MNNREVIIANGYSLKVQPSPAESRQSRLIGIAIPLCNALKEMIP
jgi:hypothetical protein